MPSLLINCTQQGASNVTLIRPSRLPESGGVALAGAVAAAALEAADDRVLSCGAGDADRSPSTGGAEESPDDEAPPDRLGWPLGALFAAEPAGKTGEEAAEGAAVEFEVTRGPKGEQASNVVKL